MICCKHKKFSIYIKIIFFLTSGKLFHDKFSLWHVNECQFELKCHKLFVSLHYQFSSQQYHHNMYSIFFSLWDFLTSQNLAPFSSLQFSNFNFTLKKSFLILIRYNLNFNQSQKFSSNIITINLSLFLLFFLLNL